MTATITTFADTAAGWQRVLYAFLVENEQPGLAEESFSFVFILNKARFC